MSVIKTEVVVIGAGPGGYAAAFAAADHKKQVTLVDYDSGLGGVCLRRGCIPSKTLLHFSKLIHEAQESEEHGVTFGKPEINLEKIRAFKNKVIGNLSGGVAGLAKARGVKVIRGRAKFESSTRLALTESEEVTAIEFEHAIIAVGSRPAVPAAFQLGDSRIMDSTGALELEDIPKKLLVIGGGYIGLEMGSVYSGLGSAVTVVEFMDGLLMAADRDLVRPLEQRLRKQFAAIHLKTKVVKLEPKPDGIHVTFEGELAEKTQRFDRVLISTGRRPNSENLGLENTRAVVDAKGFIEVDRKLRTADPHLLAIGDIAGEPMLAHKANREAQVAIQALCGEPAEFDNIAIPAVVFTDPELAWCGLTEQEAQAKGIEVGVVKFPWGASGRAQSIARTEGLTKILFDKTTERVLGVGIVGPGAGELIAEGTLAVEMAAVARDLAETIHAHPTLSETVMEGAEMLHGQATHFFRKS